MYICVCANTYVAVYTEQGKHFHHKHLYWRYLWRNNLLKT